MSHRERKRKKERKEKYFSKEAIARNDEIFERILYLIIRIRKIATKKDNLKF